MDFAADLDLSGNSILSVLGSLYVLASLLGAVLPKDWAFTRAVGRIAADLRGVAQRPPVPTPAEPVKASERGGKSTGVHVLFLAFALAATACAPTPGAKVNWPELAKCGPSPEEIIGLVTEVLLKQVDPRSALENLARTHGTTTVVCAVERLRADWSAPGAALTTERVEATQRAQVWLDATGTKVELAD